MTNDTIVECLRRLADEIDREPGLQSDMNLSSMNESSGYHAGRCAATRFIRQRADGWCPTLTCGRCLGCEIVTPCTDPERLARLRALFGDPDVAERVDPGPDVYIRRYPELARAVEFEPDPAMRERIRARLFDVDPRVLAARDLLDDEGVDVTGWTDGDLVAWYDRHRVERVTLERTRDAKHPDEVDR